ncbi:MAG: ribonuclease E activity regulator RraA [Planctomycetota bacterium]
MSSFATADLCDQHGDAVRVVQPVLRDFGGRAVFSGPIATVQVHEDNSLVRAALEEPGAGRVLVVDGGGSLRCALLGDQLAALAARNGWSGVVLNGALRDTAVVGRILLGVRALASHPRRSGKAGTGLRDVPVSFAGVTFAPGEYLYADVDGLLVSARKLD